MKYFVLAALFAIASARIVEKHIKTGSCDGIIVNNINHEKETIREYIDKPYMMSIDYDTNVLYYTYTQLDGASFSPASINLKTKDNYVIPNVAGGFATSVDPKTHKTYIGGSNGIYEFDYQTKTVRNLRITGENIWQVFAKDGIYFTTYPDENAFVYKNGKLDKVAGVGDSKAMLVGLDENDNLFFSNSSGLFYFPKGGDHAVAAGEYVVNAFTIDSYGKLYFSTPTGMFSIEIVNRNPKITKLATINNIYGMAIESDGSFIYSEDRAIIRLKSTGTVCSEGY